MNIETNNTFEFEISPEVLMTAKHGVAKIFSDYKKEEVFLTITFLTDEALLEINNEFLKHDYYTDIITFLYSEEAEPIEAELFISIERVKENAEIEKDSFEQELLRVIFHGCLHLCGLEDSTKELKTEMRRKEDEYLKMFKN